MYRRGDLEVVGDERGAVVSKLLPADELRLDADEVRWLQALALPAVMACPAPADEDASGDPEKPDPIPGQTTIDEVLAAE